MSTDDRPPRRPPATPALRLSMTEVAPTPALPSNPPLRTPVPSRHPEALERFVELLAAKQAVTEKLLEKLLETTATKEDLASLTVSTQATRSLLMQHVSNTRADRQEAERRHEAIVSLLGDIISRLPEPST